MADWKDILPDKEEQISEEDLLKYIDDTTSEDEKRLIKLKLDNNPFEADALQGLLQVQNKTQLKKEVNQLNQKLQQLTSKRHRKQKRKINSFEIIIITIVLILFVSIVCYAVIILLPRTAHHAEMYPGTRMFLSVLKIGFIATAQCFIC